MYVCAHCGKEINEGSIIWMYGKPYHLNPGCTISAYPEKEVNE